MPRKKGNAPRRLDAGERESQQWNMGQDPGSESILNINLSDDTESDDGEYVPSGSDDDVQYIGPPGHPPKSRKNVPVNKPSTKAKRKPKRSKIPGNAKIDDCLQSLIDSASFFVNIKVVSDDKVGSGDTVGEPSKTSKSQRCLSSNSVLALLGKFEFTLCGYNSDDSDANSSNVYNKFYTAVASAVEFWVYLSPIPDRSFFYFEKSAAGSKKIVDRKFYQIENVPDIEHLQAFEQGTLGLKKSGLCLTLEPLKVEQEDINNVFIDVSLIEANMPRLNHPSDMISKLSPILKITQEFFLSKASDNHEINDTDVAKSKDDDFEVVHDENNIGIKAKPDVDELYETIKNYHDQRKDIELYNPDVIINPQHKSLLPKLRPYQVNAVRWMVFRETQGDAEEVKDLLHPLYKKVILSAPNETLEDKTLYYNKAGGHFVQEKPFNYLCPPGGILADEMGLGKTVEILSLMLTHPRTDVLKQIWQEPIKLAAKAMRKVRKRKRSPSPTEFQITVQNEVLENELDEVERNECGSDVEDITSNENTVEVEETIMQVDGNQDDISSDAGEGSGDDYIPEETSSRRASGSQRTGTKIQRKKVFYDESSSDPEEGCWKPSEPSKRTSKKQTEKKQSQSSLLVQNIKKKKETNNSKSLKTKNKEEKKFDPISILEGRQVTSKSKLGDMLLFSIIKISDSSKENEASIQAIKKYLGETFEKKANDKTNKNINAEIANLVKRGQIFNTSGKNGASGSFTINPKFEDFDSRSLYQNVGEMSSMDKVIENMISKVCYNNETFIPQTQQVKKTKKKESLYDKLKVDYDRKLAACSDAYVLSDRYKSAAKHWYGTFFDTKVAPTDYFECVCGADDYGVQSDPKYRVQCLDCNQWQHAECLGYDVTDPYRGEYYCPHCWATTRPPVESSATLIVSPSAIAHQWIEEMQRHLSADVRVLFYRGTKASGYIQPQYLASNYDIVVTTYNILQSETNYVDLPHNNSSEGRRFRNPKRWMAVSAVLPCVNWWRVCLDEAQMIEVTMSKTAEMARRLSAVNRWCVTGTPIGKSLNDIHGLLLFLGMDPWSFDEWWKTCLYLPYLKAESDGKMNQKSCQLPKVLSQVMWRTAKKDVLNQIDIPAQTEEVHWLRFSPVEEAFYRRQHIECTNEAIQKFKRLAIDPSTKLSQLDRQTLASILGPLLRLRQTCCHPQMVKGLFVNIGQQKSTTLTMEELLEQLIKKVKGEVEDSNRQKVSALNGLAGLDIIEEKWKDAVEKYREVLRWVDEYKIRIKTDSLQRLHTMANLAEMLEIKKDESIPPTLRDSELRTEAKAIQDKYVAKYSTSVKAANGTLSNTSEQVINIREEFQMKGTHDSWYEKVINTASYGNDGKEQDSLMHSILDEMSQFYDVVNDREMAQIRSKYASLREVLMKISTKVMEFDKSRDSVSKQLKNLSESPPEHFVNGAVDCHLRISNVNKNKGKGTSFKCTLCEVHDLIEVYESQLFHFVRGEVKTFAGNVRQTLTAEEKDNLEKAGVLLHEEQRRGTWADSEAERLLRAVLKYAKQQGVNFSKWVLEDGQSHIRLIDAMKKEFRLMRVLWRTIYDQVAAVDEINMSTLRLRLRYEDEPIPTKAVLASMKRKNKTVSFEDEQDAQDGPRNLATKVDDKFETIYILEPHEISSQRLKLVSEKTISEHEFRKKHGQLLYLENLKKSKPGGEGGSENPDPCPVCNNPLGTEWSVLQCGHCFCIECIRMLIQEYTVRGTAASNTSGNNQTSHGRQSSVRCAICR